jgi:uncharacterized protein YxeA
MNNKQVIVVILCVIAIILIVIYTPQYKVTWLDRTNYVLTEQTSPLYKRSKAPAQKHWDKIALYAGLTLVIAGALVLVLKDKDG